MSNKSLQKATIGVYGTCDSTLCHTHGLSNKATVGPLNELRNRRRKSIQGISQGHHEIPNDFNSKYRKTLNKIR